MIFLENMYNIKTETKRKITTIHITDCNNTVYGRMKEKRERERERERER